jgi:hypothetical protein
VPRWSAWVHKTTNVLESMAKSVHPRAKASIREITGAESKKEARRAIEACTSEFGAKWPGSRQAGLAMIYKLPKGGGGCIVRSIVT